MIIRAITKSSKKAVDKYIVYMWDGRCLMLSACPSPTQGTSQWSEYFGINDADFETGKIGEEAMVNWVDLPVVIQAHIEKAIKMAQGQ